MKTLTQQVGRFFMRAVQKPRGRSAAFGLAELSWPAPLSAHKPRLRLVVLAGSVGLALIFGRAAGWAGTDTYSTAGNATWTCPPNVTSVTVECWGGGGAGGGAQRPGDSGNCAGGGGAGGAYSKTTISVTPGNSYTIVVGAGGTGVAIADGNAGGDSTFNTSSLVAKGGAGGKAGVGAGGTYGTGGTCPSGSSGTVNLGGSGAAGASSGSGGGGGSGGSSGAGGNANGITGGSAGSGVGGAGAAGSSSQANGTAATALGGGGSGAYSIGSTLRTGGAGAAGKVQITYTGADYRSKQTGNWNDTTTWQTYDGSSWVAASATPNANNNVYIQSGHTVTLQQNEACSDLHIATGTTGTSSSLLGKIALQTYTLALYGKLRCYYAAVGTTPGTSSTDGYYMYPCTASAGGKVSVAGNSRALTVSGQWSASITTTAAGTFPLEINLTPSQTATLATSIKFASLVVNAGTLDAGNYGIAADTGTVGRGDVTINNGGVLRSAMSGTYAGYQVMSQSTSTRAGVLTVNSGGRLLLTGNAPHIDMDSIVFSGAVEYNRADVQTLALRSGLDTAAANPSAYTDLILSGTSLKAIGLNTTVNGTLIMAGTDATVTLFLGTSTLTYGASSTLAYAAGAAQTTANTEFPASGGPISLTISNANGVTLMAGQTRTINGTVTMAQGVLTLGSGASLAYGSVGTLVYAGSTAQTTSVAEFPSSSGPFNLAINNVSGVTLLAGQSRTINGTVTMAQGSLTLGSGASLAYGSAGTLVYAGSTAQTTLAAEFPSSIGPFNLRINNASGVTLAFSRTMSGTLTVSPGAGLDLNSQSIICGSASLAGTLTMKINKTGPGTYTGSKLTQTAGTLTYGGALMVNNIGLALQGGEVFDLFDAPTFNTGSSFSAVTLPSPLASGLNWYTGNLAVDGTIIVNRAPVGGAHAITTRTNLPITVSANKLKAGDSDPDTNQLSITAVSDPQPSGASVSLTSGVITYNPGSAAAGGGSFKYTLEDDRGGSTLVTVTVTITDSSSGGTSPDLVYGPEREGGNFVVRFAGIPGETYTVETNGATSGSGWAKFHNYTAPTDNSQGNGIGVFQVTHPINAISSLYFRTVYPAY